MFENSSLPPVSQDSPAIASPEKNENFGSRLPEDLLNEVMSAGPSKKKIIFIVISSLIILAGIAFGGYILYDRFFGGAKENLNINNNVNISNINSNYEISINQINLHILVPCYIKKHPEAANYFPAGKIRQEYQSLAAAQDCASFTDEEIDVALSFLTIDHDNDGLNVFLERIYNTDDYKKDTDGDGYDDLTEINSGYSPTGPGKL